MIRLQYTFAVSSELINSFRYGELMFACTDNVNLKCLFSSQRDMHSILFRIDQKDPMFLTNSYRFRFSLVSLNPDLSKFAKSTKIEKSSKAI